MTSGEDKSRDVDTAVEDLRRYKAHLSEIARYIDQSHWMPRKSHHGLPYFMAVCNNYKWNIQSDVKHICQQ